MSLLDWKEEYLLGIDFIDFEHRDLFERINDLCAKCVAHGGSADVEDCMGRLHARLAAHFALEEKAMREMKNPYYEGHKAEHERFLDEITGAMMEFGEGTDQDEIMVFAERVRGWIVNHITTYDRQLVEKE